jgi:hypothetical protein
MIAFAASLVFALSTHQAPAPDPVRVRLKSRVPGVHLVRADSGDKLCLGACGGELLLTREARYALVDHDDAELVGDIGLPPRLSSAVIHYQGRDSARLAAGVAGSVLGGSSALAALALVIASLVQSAQPDGGPGSRQLALTGLGFAAGAVLFGVPGAILWAEGAKHRCEVSDR